MLSSTTAASGKCSSSQCFWDFATWVGLKAVGWYAGVLAGAHHWVKGATCLNRGACAVSTKFREQNQDVQIQVLTLI
jgi:hypothetical protein